MISIFAAYPPVLKIILQALIFSIIALPFCGCDQKHVSSASGSPVILKFTLQADSTYKYIIDSKLTLQPEIKGQTLNITQNIKLVSSFHVLNTNRFGRNVMISYNRIIMTSDNGAAKNEYDSDDSTNHNPLFAQISGMINKPYKLLIKDNGSVMTSSNEDTTLFSDSSMRKMIMQCLNVYPLQAVKPGDSWKKSYNTSTGFLHMHMENTFILNSVSNNIAHIDISGKITPEDSLQNMAFKGVQSGNMDIDLHTGMIISSKIAQQLSGNINIGGRTNPVNATAEISITYAK